jgi:transcription elongation factor greA
MYTDYLYRNSYKSYNIDYVREDDDIILESKNVEESLNGDIDKEERIENKKDFEKKVEIEDYNNRNDYNHNNNDNFSTKNNQNGESYRNVISDEKKEMEEKIDRIISSYRGNVNNPKEVNVENAVNIAIEKSTEINREKNEKKEVKKTKFVHKNSWYSVEEDDDSEEENNNEDVQEKELEKERDLEINNREIMEEKEVYLTKEGYEKLEEELKILKTEERDNIEERIKVAKSFGDLSENSEYDEARSAQAANENKILEIEQMLKKAKIIDEKDIDTTTVQVGNTVYITNIANNKEQKYTIVGTAEANVLQGKISNESPIAKSLLRSKSWRCSSSRSTSWDYRI